MNRARHPRGVSLIEALVALAVMAFGLLGVVGMQSTMRFNADVSKQRSEAVRMAQAQVEELRMFNALSGTADPDYVEIASIPIASVVVPTGYANTEFSMATTVTNPAADAPQFKTLDVEVTWLDRRSSGTPNQSVRLTTAIAGVAPELSATLSLPGDRAAPQRPRGRHPAIPPSAVASGFGDGRSIFSPPGAGSRKWVFNNATGEVTKVCTDTPTDVTYTGCSDKPGLLLSGYVNFATGTAPTPTEARSPVDGIPVGHAVGIELIATTSPAPPSSPECYVQSTSLPVAYFCLVPTKVLTPRTWSGQSLLTLVNTSTGASALPSLYKVCRYTPEATHTPSGGNAAHPLNYAAVSTSLINQNFLVISSGDGTVSFDCPADLTPPALGNTYAHQPSS